MMDGFLATRKLSISECPLISGPDDLTYCHLQDDFLNRFFDPENVEMEQQNGLAYG